MLSRRLEERDHRRAQIATFLPVGVSEGVRAVMRHVEKIARSDAPVLVQGETGSGKELIARVIWSRSSRGAGPLVPINCGAVPDGLIETELFGHGAGAFTDAKHAREGVIAQAQHGTLFLDEINTSITFYVSSVRSTACLPSGCTLKRLRGCAHITGRETFASWRTGFIGRFCSPKATRFGPQVTR